MPFSDHLLCHATMQHCLLMCPLLQRCNLDTSSIRGAKLSAVVPQLEQQSIESLEAISQRLACAAVAVALQEFVFVPLLCELLVPRYPATQDIDLRFQTISHIGWPGSGSRPCCDMQCLLSQAKCESTRAASLTHCMPVCLTQQRSSSTKHCCSADTWQHVVTPVNLAS